jgi:hypothetical protein
MNFGLLGDFDALPDIDRVGEAIGASIAELVALARKQSGGSGNGKRGAATAPAPEVVSP